MLNYERRTLREEDSGKKVDGESSNQVTVDDLETMCRALHAYRFGTIGFLDLLALWEEVLGIELPQPGR